MMKGNTLLDKVQIVEPVTLRELRTLSGLTTRDFARILNMSESSYARRERGSTGLYASERLALSKVFGIDERLIEP